MAEQKSASMSDEFYINCSNCDREIEFGWPQLDRHGLIYPVELADFKPFDSLPDPKYVETWRKQGWLAEDK